MRATWLLSITLSLAISAAQAQATFSTLKGQAMSAYEAKEYGKAGVLIDQAMAKKPAPTASDYYDAACMWAIAGNSNKAFGYLDQATNAGFYKATHLRGDSDLASLHADRRWQPMLAKLEATIAKAEAHVNQPLKKELAELYRTDQGIRLKIDSVEKKSGMDAAMAPALVNEMRRVDEYNLARLLAIIKQHGWPGKTLVGSEGSTTAFLIIQHADAETQRQYLPVLREAAAKGELQKSALALLEDRVLTGQGKPQRYGSQLRANMGTKKYEFYPIEDEAHVDERRAAMGLEPLADYARQFGLEYHPKTL
jgi:hypothetical protein